MFLNKKKMFSHSFIFALFRKIMTDLRKKKNEVR